jgi:nucleotidyltransferase substrate binding protein (TIGR01987 family)
MNNKADIRWQQRFNNFKRAVLLLRSALEERALSEYSNLEQEGIIKRFEYTLELAWKVLKDRMEDDGIIIGTISPKGVIRQAFNSKYINNPEIWMRMIGDRNLLSHTYDFEQFSVILQTVKNEYLPVLDEFYLECFAIIING